MHKTEIKFFTIIIFFFLLSTPFLTNSHAVPTNELKLFNTPETPLIFNSDIIDIDENFFLENNC